MKGYCTHKSSDTALPDNHLFSHQSKRTDEMHEAKGAKKGEMKYVQREKKDKRDEKAGMEKKKK